NLMNEYRERVVSYLLDGYQRGLTPNPDVMCNREIKFGLFRQWAKDHDFDAVATGHYAQRLPLQAAIAAAPAVRSSAAILPGGSPSAATAVAPAQRSAASATQSALLEGADPNKDLAYLQAQL